MTYSLEFFKNVEYQEELRSCPKLLLLLVGAWIVLP